MPRFRPPDDIVQREIKVIVRGLRSWLGPIGRGRKELHVGFISGLVAALAPAALCCQSAREIRLAAPFVVIGEPIESVAGIRELDDRSVLVADSKAGALLLLTAGGQNRQIGRQGDGPLEYRVVTRLMSLPGDSSLLFDGQSRRLLWTSGSQPLRNGIVDAKRFGHLDAEIVGADGVGRLLVLLGYRSSQNVNDKRRPPYKSVVYADSLLVLRGRPDMGPVDTITRIRGGWSGLRVALKRFRGIPISYLLSQLPPAADEITTCGDGWIAIAHLLPPAVEWLSPDGRSRSRASLASLHVRVDESVKRRLIESEYGREVGSLFTSDEFPSWPNELPPFPRGALSCSSDGRAVIERESIRGSPKVYDVIDRTGVVVGRLTLPRGSHIAGFGERTVYVAVQDSDDLIQLRRYAWTGRP